MLKANIGLSRKITRDYNSTGYSVNIDGEIPFTPDDPEAVLEKVRELFNLAQEALFREIDRDQGEQAIGRRDEEPSAPATNNNQPAANPPQSGGPAPTNQNSPARNGTEANGHGNGNADAATDKQVQFLLSMAKRFKLTPPQLENRIGQIIGRKCGANQLTKKEAGRVLDQLTNGGQPNGSKS